MGSIFKALFSSPKQVQPPKVVEAPVAPEADPEKLRLAKRKKVAEMRGRSGRVSTMLSESGGTKKFGG